MAVQDVMSAKVGAVRHASRGVELMARAGYAARGVVYVLVGGLAVVAAVGGGGRTTGGKGALSTLLGHPGGKILLGFVALGLAGFAVWRFVEAVLDPEGRGTDGKALLARAAHAVSGIIYAGLALWAATAVFGGGGGGGGSSSQTFTGKLLSAPAGRWLVGLVGLVILGYAVQQVRQAWKARFMERMKTRDRWLERAGRAGYAARAVVFTLVGVFLFQAALTYDSSQAGGLGKALQTLASQPYGPWLLGLVALGLVGYGAYSILAAKYRRIVPPG